MKELGNYIEQIRKLCESSKVKSLFAFGSVLREDFKAESDLDFVVDIDEKDPVLYADNYFNLKFQLEKLFQRKVDLLEEKAIKNPYIKKQIDQSKVLIYG